MRDSIQKIIDALNNYAQQLQSQYDELESEQAENESEIAQYDGPDTDAPEEIDNSEAISEIDGDLNNLSDAITSLSELSCMEQTA